MSVSDWFRSLFTSNAILRHEGSKWVLYSHKGEKLGTFDTEKEGKKREQEINYFTNK